MNKHEDITVSTVLINDWLICQQSKSHNNRSMNNLIDNTYNAMHIELCIYKCTEETIELRFAVIN